MKVHSPNEDAVENAWEMHKTYYVHDIVNEVPQGAESVQSASNCDKIDTELWKCITASARR